MPDDRQLSASVRQIRCKAKKLGCHCDLPFSDVRKMAAEAKGCDFCEGHDKLSLYIAFPAAPWVMANLLLCCQYCRPSFNQFCPDLLSMPSQRKVSWEKLGEILERLMRRPGAPEVQAVIRKMTGLE